MKRGPQSNTAVGKRFEQRVALLLDLFGFAVERNTCIGGMQIDILAAKELAGVQIDVVVECKRGVVSANDANQVIAERVAAEKSVGRHVRVLVVSESKYRLAVKERFAASGISYLTYQELLDKLVPTRDYARALDSRLAKQFRRKLDGLDWFVEPRIRINDELPVAARPTIHKWILDDDSSLFVVLGNLGSGKTSLLEAIADRLIGKFTKDPVRHPLPLLIPLKEARHRNTLEDIIASHFRKCSGTDSTIDFPSFLRLVKEGHIIPLFDAFDEMCEHVQSHETREKFHQLCRVIQDGGKAVITCRTHYFSTEREERQTVASRPDLTGNASILASVLHDMRDVHIGYLEEFDESQILDYLSRIRPDTVARDWEVITRTHNLRDLAQRPITLDMIGRTLGKLPTSKAIVASELYESYTNLWIYREENEAERFKLTPSIKIELMLELAHRLWQTGKADLNYEELVPFVREVAAEEVVDVGDATAEMVAHELQLASFMDRDKDNFSFAHRSFMEYFLALRVYRACTEGRGGGLERSLDAPALDRKVIFFFQGLDAEGTAEESLRRALRHSYKRRVSENALHILYWVARTAHRIDQEIDEVEALRRELAKRIPGQMQLGGADLSNAELSYLDFCGADLSHARFTGAFLTGANLDGDFDNADFRRCFMKAAQLSGSFRHADFREATLQGVTLKLEDSSLDGVKTDPKTPVALRVQEIEKRRTAERERMRVQETKREGRGDGPDIMELIDSGYLPFH